MELNDLRSYKKLCQKDAKLATQVESVYNATKETINSISGCYNNYTMHDMSHGLRVASYMEDLAFGIDDEFDKNMDEFNAFELALLILSAILHDIGMFIRPEDRENIKSNRIPYTTSLTFEGVLKVVNGNEDEAVKEIIRITHPQRIKEFIRYDFERKTIYDILQLDDKYPFADDIVEICISHGESYEYLKKMRKNQTKGNYSYNPQFLAAMLRIADYLDLDKQRTPVLWYNIMRIDGFSKEEWEKHFIVHNEKKLKKYLGNKKQIFFEGKSSNAKIHRKYLKYIDDLKIELENADELLNVKDADPKYRFKISTKIDDCVATQGFKYSDLRLNLDYSSITELLMGKNIYGTCKLGLRELVQNSIDACEIMREIQKNNIDSIIEPQIFVVYSKANNYVKIKDTGIGMTLDVVKKHFLNVGKSYYKSNEYLYENYKYKPIGHYGIGFLACFLLSDNVTVKTKYYKNNEINQIELEKSSEYVVTNIEETGTFFGTEIILEYNTFFEVFKHKDKLIEFLEKYFYTDIPIKVRDDDLGEEYRLINNCCERVVSGIIEKDYTNTKFETIECKKYSDCIEGTIKIQSTQRRNNFIVTETNDQYYCFNSIENKFDKYEYRSELDGYYRKIRYVEIDNVLYERIKKSRKLNKNKRKDIFAASTKTIYLIIDETSKFGIQEIDEISYQFTINNVLIKDILINSGLKYYDELLDEYEYFEQVFIANGTYIDIQGCDFEGLMYMYGSDLYKQEFFVYNKGILIRNFRGISCGVPAAIKPLGYINYIGDEIKLDVSRNSIIEGIDKMGKELTCILLKYLKANSDDEKFIQMIDCIISFNEKL